MTKIIRPDFLSRRKPFGKTRDVERLVGKVERAALQIVRTKEPTKSQLGGDPCLPNNVAWPYRGDTRLRFLARISLTDLQAADGTPWLPRSGALLFFYDDDTQPWGFDPADRGGWAVLHVPDTAQVPSSSESETPNLLPSSPVTFRRIHTLPDFEREEVQALELTDSEFSEYFEIATRRYGGLPKHQLLGLPAPMQGNNMERECQLASNGVYCGNSQEAETERAKALEGGARDWRLLLQLDSDEELGVAWGDAGRLYFWIEDSAARKGDFSNVWLVLQCG
jgi:uncharacterized protein YwqG